MGLNVPLGAVVAAVALSLGSVTASAHALPASASDTESFVSASVSTHSLALSPTSQWGRLQFSAVVNVPTGAKLTLVAVTLSRTVGPGSTAIIAARAYCGDPKQPLEMACVQSGSLVPVTFPVPIDKDSTGVSWPGAYSVTASAEFEPWVGANTVEVTLPSTVTIKRATAIGLTAGPKPVRRGARIAVSGALRRTMSYACPCTNGLDRRWVAFPKATVHIYFDPKGSAPRKLVRTVTTGSRGTFAWTTKATVSGTWSASYGGNSAYTPRASTGVYVRVR